MDQLLCIQSLNFKKIGESFSERHFRVLWKSNPLKQSHINIKLHLAAINRAIC